MKTAILGGTFNPLHIGHLYLAEELRVSCKYERIIFIPSNIPPHKNVDENISSATRLEMTMTALEGTGFTVDDCEIRRGGVSYMVDTVTDLENRLEITGKPGLLVGDDLVWEMESWSRWSELKNMVDLIVARRSIDPPPRYNEPHFPLNNILVPVSSSEIRCRIRNNMAYRFLVPEKVYNYINKKKLYQHSD